MRPCLAVSLAKACKSVLVAWRSQILARRNRNKLRATGPQRKSLSCHYTLCHRGLPWRRARRVVRTSLRREGRVDACYEGRFEWTSLGRGDAFEQLGPVLAADHDGVDILHRQRIAVSQRGC